MIKVTFDTNHSGIYFLLLWLISSPSEKAWWPNRFWAANPVQSLGWGGCSL